MHGIDVHSSRCILFILMEKNTDSPKNKSYKRIILKLSGEVLRNPENGDPICPEIMRLVCEDIKQIHDMGAEIGVVLGGGNIFRGLAGAQEYGVDRTTGDSMGMLATVINGLALMDCLEKLGVQVRVQTATPMDKLAEPYIQRRAIRHLEKGRVVIFVAGTGNPYFSTDTTAALRGSEIHADVIMKATKVDGVYDKDPNKFEDAVKFDEISYMEALEKRLNIMDATAFSLCMDNEIPILVFNMKEPGNILRAVQGERIGTLVQ